MSTSPSNNWTKWEPQSPSGKFEKYKNQIVVIIARNKQNAKHKAGRIYLTEKVMELLKQPSFIELYTRGPNIGIGKAMNAENSYTISNLEGDATPVINCVAFIERLNLSMGVYNAHYEEPGMIVFDMQQTPARF